MNRFYIILALLLYCAQALPQTITLSGYVRDASTGERLIGAAVYDNHSLMGTSTNSYGFYSITLPFADSLAITASHLGYSACIKWILPLSGSNINFSLVPGIAIDEVEVTASRTIPIEQRNEMSVNEITARQIKLLPAIGGEPDLLKSFQLMPGVSGGSEGSSAIYVRGGSPDQNLIILDDVPLYYVDHMGGFVSSFNADAINSVKLTKGGFPARYGGRLSSVLDIRMKDGNTNEFKGNATAGMIVTKAMVEGPIIPDTASYMLSIRRFMYDLITRPVTRLIFDGVSMGYYFYDINAKVNYKLSSRNHLYISMYAGKDKFDWSFKGGKDETHYKQSEDALEWGNLLGAIRWNHQFNDRVFSNLTLYYTGYRYSIERLHNRSHQKYYSKFSSGIKDVSAKYDVEFSLSSRYKLKLGGSSIYHTFSPGVTQYKITDQIAQQDTTLGASNTNAWENAIYIENDIEITPRTSLNAGVRTTVYKVNSKEFFSISPRLSIRFMIAEHASLKASYASMQQNVHLLTSTGVGLPADLWVPATEPIVPAQSHQVAVGYAQTLANRKYELGIESYYKSMSNLIAYQPGASHFGSSVDWQDKLETQGKGNSYGLEIMLQKVAGQSTGWMSYTLSKSNRQFDNLNEGKPFPFKYDRRHDIAIVLMHQFTDNIEFSATWNYSTGSPITLAVGKYDIIYDPEKWDGEEARMQEVEIYPGINTFRMRDFHRLDIGLNIHKQKTKGQRTWNFSVFNVYNRQNPYFYFIEDEGISNDNLGSPDSELGKVKLMQFSQFPLMPSVSYSFSF